MIWLAPLVLAGLLLGVWVFATTQAQENQTTKSVHLDSYGIPNLAIRIQYPSVLSTANVGINAKRIVIFPTGVVISSLQSITITLNVPPGVVNFVDTDGNQIVGKVQLDIDPNGSQPVEIRIEHAQTRQAEDLKAAHFTTSIEAQGIKDTPVPELEFDILLETTAQRLFREFGKSTIGTLAPLVAFIVSIGGIIYKIYDRRRRIEPTYRDLQHAIQDENWDEAIKLCERIIEIDPTYDSVDELRENARNQLSRQLETLYQQASNAYWTGKDDEAIAFYKKILGIDKNYKDTEQRLKSVIDRQKRAFAKNLSEIDAEVRHRIVESLAILADNDNWQSAAQTLIEIGQPAVEPLLSTLGRDYPVWRRVVDVLQPIVGDELKSLLRENLQNEDLTIQTNAANALEILDSRSITDASNEIKSSDG